MRWAEKYWVPAVQNNFGYERHPQKFPLRKPTPSSELVSRRPVAHTKPLCPEGCLEWHRTWKETPRFIKHAINLASIEHKIIPAYTWNFSSCSKSSFFFHLSLAFPGSLSTETMHGQNSYNEWNSSCERANNAKRFLICAINTKRKHLNVQYRAVYRASHSVYTS